MLVLSNIVRANFFEPLTPALLDPVITASQSKLRFEGSMQVWPANPRGFLYWGINRMLQRFEAGSSEACSLTLRVPCE